ncbi:hypothetical protein GOBAR_DD29025 [Gossypium barbadense]|nr:hypothetical protein GOBAR_DD29025 [Gossypium barbadense]
MAENINALLERLNFTEEESVRVMSSNVKSSKTQGYEAWAVGKIIPRFGYLCFQHLAFLVEDFQHSSHVYGQVGSHRRGQSNREIVANGTGKMKCKRERLKGSNGKNTNESLIRLVRRKLP